MASRSRARKTPAPRIAKQKQDARPVQPQRSEDEVSRALGDLSPEELYQIEKRRRAGGTRPGPQDDRLAAAKREFEAMLAAEAGTPRGGRPRKKPVVTKKPDDFDDLEETGEPGPAGEELEGEPEE